MRENTFARMAYEAYRTSTGGVLPISGSPMPDWEDLRPVFKDAWRSAAIAVMAAVEGGL